MLLYFIQNLNLAIWWYSNVKVWSPTFSIHIFIDGELLLNTNPQNKSSNVNYNKNKTKTSVLHHKFRFFSWGNNFGFLTLEAKQ